MKITFDFQAILWTNVKAYCPICKRNFTSWYCPSCGLPKKNSKYALTEYGSLHNCADYHFRPEFSSFENFQLCDKCYTPNPYGAKYCKNCGENITLHAKDKNGHGWIDLGLSVLWSTDSLQHRFLWNDNTIIYEDNLDEIRDLYKKSNYGEIGGKDAATHHWGEKWRTPTKEDFEELITKCKWEKYIIPTTNQFALKAIGPNGNSIVFPTSSGKASGEFSLFLWSSTKENNTRAFALYFHEKIEYKSTPTAKQKKRMEFAKSNETRFKVDLSTDEWLRTSFEQHSKMIEEKRKKIYPQYEKTLEQQRKILDAMGDDSHEIEYNKKADLKRFQNLWLTTPIKITNLDNDIASGTMILRSIGRRLLCLGIRPVADKKWQGKL